MAFILLFVASFVLTVLTNVRAQSFSNPILWEDLADLDVIRVNDTYYYSASTMHYSPGAPILRSFDLVNWEFIGHSVPSLAFGSQYNLSNGQRAYVKGIWASSLRYRPSNGLFYWMGCVEFSKTYVYTAPSINGPWTQAAVLSTCFYDCGILVDDNDTMYVAYGNTGMNVAQLAPNGLSIAKTQQIFNSTSAGIGTLEGSRFYKINGNYYIFTTRPADAEFVLKASSPFGPYTSKALVTGIQSPVSGSGNPHQGGAIQTQSGQWYYMAFIDSYPGGRIPVLAPMTFGSDGFPTLQSVNGAWGASYPYPASQHTLSPFTGTDSFTSSSLGPQWEWNHNPDTTKFTVGSGLKLCTATMTFDLYSARNTLTHRILGPTSTATIVLNYASMLPGDRAGLAIFRDTSAWIGIKNDGGTFRVVMINGLAMDASWNTINTGSEVAGLTVSGGKIWLRAAADIHIGTGKQAKFSYSTDGNTFNPLGVAFTLNNTWQFFMGYRYGIFNYATTNLGGSVTVSSFTMSTP